MRSRILLLLLAALLCLGMARKPPLSLRLHGEGTASEAPTFAFPANLLSGRPVYLQRMPLVTEREIRAFHAFEADDGSYGACFQLDNHGRKLLEQFSMSRRGTYLVAIFNGRQVADLFVDRTVSDGILCIKRGLTSEDVTLLGRHFGVIGGKPRKPVEE